MATCDVFALADYLAARFECKFVIVLGCRDPAKLQALYSKYKLIGFDDDKNSLLSCTQNFPEGNWVKHDLEGRKTINLSDEILSQGLILCSDVILNMREPHYMLSSIKEMMNHAKVGLLSSGAKQEVNNHLMELEQLIEPFQFNIEFTGLTPDTGRILESEEQEAIVILGHNHWNKKVKPRDNKIIAIMPTYNEKDIVYHSIKKLVVQQIYVYVIDNWSTDSSLYEVNKFKVNPYLLGVEQFPKEGPSRYSQWSEILKRVAHVAQELDGDWFILHDVDEIRESPWEDLNLREAVNYVDQMGYNAVNFTVINFHPVDNGFQTGQFESYFKFFNFGREPFYFNQTKMWKKVGDQEVILHEDGGHTAQFAGSKVCPYKFLSRHYPLRSQQHANQKIFHDRKNRWDPEEIAKDWHTHYYLISEGDSVLWNPEELIRFEMNGENSFYRKYLLERISGLGI